jgi:tetraacyldisaccharide 4'-kinase
MLSQGGQHISVLSRGYGRSTRGVLPVSRGEGLLASPHECGDEPYLLARNLPKCWVTVGEDRFAAGALVESSIGKCAHLLDDGYQHLRLNRSMNILLLDATCPFGGGRLLPSGRLREPLEAIRRADLIVITRADHPFDDAAVVRQIREIHPRTPILYAHSQARGLVSLATREMLPMRDFFCKRVLAFSGIAGPRLFRDLLAHYQMDVAGHIEFGDHHRYRQEEIDRLFEEAGRIGADALVTTEKDEINLRGLQIGGLPCYYLRIEAQFAKAEQIQFFLQELMV